MSSEFDILIKDATIVDGTGKPPFKGTIGVVGERITAIGEVKGDASEVIDASGLTATPGFIDAHSHADENILWYPKCESFVMQGITTFVGGQCGGSPAPLGEMVRVPHMLANYLDQLDPHKYYPKPLYQLEQVNEWMEEKFGWTIDWKTMDGFFKRVEEKRISANYAPLVGHGNIRFMVMGMDYKRHATQEEVDQMMENIHQAMKEKCLGMSTGMDYVPDAFASQEEIIQCVAVLKDYDAVYSTHWRKSGLRRGLKVGAVLPDRINGIKEAIEVCRKTGVPLHISHIKAGYEISPRPPLSLQRANVQATLDVIDEARDEGLNVTFDWQLLPENLLRLMPYLCGELTPWIRETGSPERLAEFLKMEDYREEVKDAIFSGKWYVNYRYSPAMHPHWAENITVLKHVNQNYEGKSIAEISKLRERDQLDTFFDLISEDPYAMGGRFFESREWEKVFLNHPIASVCLDGLSFDDKYQQERPPYSFPKSGAYDGFVMMLVIYVKEQKLFSIEEAVKKMTTKAAEAYKLKGRGKLKSGFYADIVLIDMPNLKLMSDSLEQRRYPKGIEYVIVNGTKVVEKGEHTSARPGKVLRRA